MLLDHVELVTEGRVSLFQIVCIHAVIRGAGIARLRVVLDASGKMRDDTWRSSVDRSEVAADFAVHNNSMATMAFCTYGEYIRHVPANVS